MAPPEGLRARKRRATRQRIAETALRLFLANGYDGTTLDAIAAAADISRRSFFHYFQSKEAILEAWENDVDDAFRAAIMEQPPSASPLRAVQGGIISVIARYLTEEAMAVDRLMRSTEALRARKTAHYERQEQALLAALTARWPDPARLAELRMVAMAGVGALRLAIEAWREAGGAAPLSDYLNAAFTVLAGL